ncbi:twin-arginine translocase TatA/TatE family subunit [Brevibacterium samyangense]|uniref:twin-arginine translocase TatA/TatE family subunit n=1 Tax=Brevibacterium samyangense TaxID=366888 RepID=UPI0031D18069
MFGINGSEMIILVVVALIVIGPQRLPEYAQQFKDFVKAMKRKADDARENVKRDFGDDFKDVDWQKLDPRQYDPRRIVREALQEEDSVRPRTTSGRPGGDAATGSGAATATATRISPVQRHKAQAALRNTSAPAPFDPEAT